ncbi:two-component sensor histidine kinase [Paenibacillus baekrokdamisoli]|uniref:histidine kinase n=1 Tax=Paenibacillus baekrokdamisoli TaxID=1712516 RepID=A0A3G9JCU5_9BACL|nr:ATP-binding protein [Paenibacillus baekrokdamisoli]MBB3069867.1 signal transduction histidine kinase [Paenibacillus baekrokdamisoli]BBH20779.1 two-component sensor histidine kinase [Paenibacillus baekrokdamisoli]
MKVRWLLPLFWSAMMSVIGFGLIVIIAKMYFYSSLAKRSPKEIFNWFNWNVGYPTLYVVAIVILFIISAAFFFPRDRRLRHNNYLAQMTEDVERIASGDLQHKVLIRQEDGLKQLAIHINRFVEQLDLALAEERRAQQSKNELITNVSHDLRTPLTSITGYLGLIEQDRYRDEVELRYYISLVYEESERMSQLIQDLFEYTRLRNNEMKLHANKINLVEMLHQLTEQFQLQLEQADLQPRMNFSAAQLIVFADGNKLRRVFENLITNAIKYGRDGQYLDFNGYKENGQIVLDIVNYGEVIPSSDLPHIFDRFYRVEKSRAIHSGGSGLGLAIAKQIVELHEGKLHASSTLEQTAFTVKLMEYKL